MAKIIHKKSAVVGKLPTTADLEYGELALNYADGKLFYKASNNSIQSFGGAALSNVVRQQFTATAGQTNFTISYTPGQLDVYLNGVKLVSGSDYTATSGTGFTLTTAAAVGDIVDVVAGIIFASSDWAYVTNKPTTISGFGITDAQPLSTNLTSISALTGTAGFLKTNGSGTFSVDQNTYITGNQNIVFSGDATGNGTTSVALTLANSGVTAGTYTKVTVDSKGRVTTGTTLASADLPTYTGTITSSQVTTALGFTPYNSTNPSGYISGNQTITFTGDATGTGTTSVALTLANSGVTAGTYGSSTAVPVIVVDAKGRVTGVSTQNISGALTFTGDVTGTGTTGSSTALTLSNSGVTAGTYTKVTVDAKGRTTSGTTLAASDIPSLDASKITSGTIDAARLPSYVDDVLEYANLATFPGTGETAKIYVALDSNKTYRWSGSAYIEISPSPGTTDSLVEGSTNLYFTNARARSAISVTQNLTYNSTTGVITGPNLSSYLTGNQTISFSGDATGSGTTSVALTLANSGVTAGTYTKVTVDAKGRVTTGTTLASADLPTYTGTITSSQVTTALGFTPYNSTNPSGYITNAGSITGSSARLNSSDTRTINPASHSNGSLTFGFTSWTNNNTSNWADYLHLRSYTDSSGGSDNLVMFSKSGINMRIWQQTFGSSTSYASYVDVLHSNNYNNYSPTLTGTGASGTWGISITGNASTATTLQTARTINGVSFNGSANITVADSTKLPLSGGTLTGGLVFSAATGYNPIQITGGVAGYYPAVQDGNGRVNWYWNKAGSGGAPTFEVSSEDAVRMKFSTSQAAGNEAGIGVYWAAAGTAGAAITWTEILGAFHNRFQYLGNTVLHAGNYTSYSPTLTGTGASGTWGISITGNAATVTNGVYTTGAQSVGGVKTFNNGLTIAAGQLLTFNGYGESHSIYVTDVTGAGNGHTRWIFEATDDLMFNQGWEFRSKRYDGVTANRFYIPGDGSTPTANGNAILHAGNYTSYSPSLTGSGASGTWGINITGSAGAVPWGSISGQRTITRDNAGLRGDAGARSGFFETSAPTNYYSGASSWQHLIEARHTNDSNNYAMQIAGSFFDQEFYVRKTNDSATTAWSRMITSANISQFASGDNSLLAYFMS